MATILDLRTHPTAYVTVSELAAYWDLSRERVYKHIDEGALLAMRLGPRSYRIPTRAAVEFERRMSSLRGKLTPVPVAHPRPRD